MKCCVQYEIFYRQLEPNSDEIQSLPPLASQIQAAATVRKA
jgi:hypothetical protein